MEVAFGLSRARRKFLDLPAPRRTDVCPRDELLKFLRNADWMTLGDAICAWSANFEVIVIGWLDCRLGLVYRISTTAQTHDCFLGLEF